MLDQKADGLSILLDKPGQHREVRVLLRLSQE
jgi:hypothetical protein